MAKNLLDILKGSGGSGAGVKGTWDVTPVVATLMTAVDSVNMTWDSATGTATADWTGAGTPTNGLPVAAAAILSATVGDLAVDQVKQFAMKASANFFAVTQGAAMLSFTIVPETMTADQLRQLFVNFVLNPSQTVPTPVLQTFIQNMPGQGVDAIAQANLASDTTPEGPSSPVRYLTEALSPSHQVAVFFTRKQPGGVGTPTEVHVAEAVFDSTSGTLVGLGAVDIAYNNPVIPPNSKLAVAILYLPMNGVFEPLSFQASLTAAPSVITLPVDFGTTPTAGAGSFSGVTQGDLDLIFSNPATDIASVAAPPFPIGTKKNDMWRIRNTTPLVQAVPYGTPVFDDDIIIVDNVTPGSEALRVDVYSTYLEQALAAPNAIAAEALSRANSAGTMGGKAVFFVRSTDSFISNPLSTTTQNVFTTFLAAYQAAIALPKHIQKVIVIDNRSTSQRQTIPAWIAAGSNYETYYLAANNIKLSTMTFWGREEGSRFDGLSSIAGEALQQTVIVHGKYDALHFAGGAFAVANSGDSGSPNCVPYSPSVMVATPNGFRKGLEVGDYTQLYLSPLAFNFDQWGYYYSAVNPNRSLTIGDNCFVGIYPDLSVGSAAYSAGITVFGVDVSATDSGLGHVTPGRLDYFPASYASYDAGVEIRLGEGTDFTIAPGTATYGGGAPGLPGFIIHAPLNQGTINLGDTGTAGTYPVTNSIVIDGSAAGSSYVSSYADFKALGNYTAVGGFGVPSLDIVNVGAKITDDIDLAAEVDASTIYGMHIQMYNAVLEGVTKADHTKPVFKLRNDGNYGSFGVLSFPNYGDGVVIKNLKFQPEQIPGGNLGRLFALNQVVAGVTFEDCELDFTATFSAHTPSFERIRDPGFNSKPLIFRRCTFTTLHASTLALTGTVGVVIFDECHFSAGSIGPISLAGATINGHVTFNNCTTTGAEVVNVGTFGSDLAAFGAGGKLVVRNLRHSGTGVLIDVPITGTFSAVISNVIISKDTDTAGNLSEVTIGLNTGGTVGRSATDPYNLTSAFLNKKIAIEDNVDSAVTTLMGADEHGFVRISDALLDAFSADGTDAVEITLKSNSNTDATFTVDPYSGNHNIVSSGRVPVYVTVRAGKVNVDRDEVVDNLFEGSGGTGLLAFRLDAKAVAGKSFVPTIRLDSQSKKGASGIPPVVKLSLNRSKADQGYRALAGGQLLWSDVGGTIKLESTTPTFTLPNRGYGGASPEELGMDHFMGKSITFKALAGGATITLNAPGSHKIYSAANPAGVSSESIVVPAFGQVTVQYFDHGVNSNYFIGWAVFL